MLVYTHKLIASLWAKVAIIDASSVWISVKQEGEIIGENSVELTTNCTSHQFLTVLWRAQGHYSAIELSLMGHVPFSIGDIQPFKLAVSASNINGISLETHTKQPIAWNWHGSSINLISNAEETNFSSGGTSEEHVSGNVGEIVVSCEACVWQLALSLFQNVLHWRNFKF